MAKISQLPAASQLGGLERLPIVQAGETRGVSMTNLRGWFSDLLSGWHKGDTGPRGRDASEMAWTQAILGAAGQTTFVVETDFLQGKVDVLLNGVELLRSQFSTPDARTVVLDRPLETAGWVVVKGFHVPNGLVTAFDITMAGAHPQREDNAPYIQKALESGYRHILLPPGVFNASEFELPSGVHLIGAGGTIKAVRGTNFQLKFASEMNGGGIIGVDFDCTHLTNVNSPHHNGESFCIGTPDHGTLKNVRVADNTFRNIPAAVSVDNDRRIHAVQFVYGEAEVADNYCDGCAGDIYNFNAGVFVVTGNKAFNGGDGGIAMNNNAQGIVAGNIIRRCDLGAGLGHAGTTAGIDYAIAISGNDIQDCREGINLGWFGFAGQEAPREAKITGNTIKNCKRNAIRYDGRDSVQPALLIIDGNTITGTGSTNYDGAAPAPSEANTDGVGLFVGGGRGVVISNNVFSRNLGDDLRVGSLENDYTIVGNSFSYPAGGSPRFAINTGVDSGTIQANTFAGRGIHVVRSTRLDVHGNIFRAIEATGAVVIDLTSGIDLTVRDNSFYDCPIGVEVGNLAGWYSHGITDNKFYNCPVKVRNSPLPREDDDYVESYYVGQANAAGAWQLPHQLGEAGRWCVVAASGWARQGSQGDAIPLAVSSIEGVHVNFAGAPAGAQVRAWLRINKDAPSW